MNRLSEGCAPGTSSLQKGYSAQPEKAAGPTTQKIQQAETSESLKIPAFQRQLETASPQQAPIGPHNLTHALNKSIELRRAETVAIKVPLEEGSKIMVETNCTMWPPIQNPQDYLSRVPLKPFVDGLDKACTILEAKDTTIESIIQRSSELVSEVQRQKILVENLANKVTSLTNEVTSLTNEGTSLNNEVASLTNKVTSLTSEVTTLTSEVTSLTNKVTSLNNEVASLTNKVTSLTNNHHEQIRLMSIQEILTDTQNVELEKLKTTLQKAEQECATYREKYNRAQSAVLVLNQLASDFTEHQKKFPNRPYHIEMALPAITKVTIWPNAKSLSEHYIENPVAKSDVTKPVTQHTRFTQKQGKLQHSAGITLKDRLRHDISRHTCPAPVPAIAQGTSFMQSLDEPFSDQFPSQVLKSEYRAGRQSITTTELSKANDPRRFYYASLNDKQKSNNTVKTDAPYIYVVSDTGRYQTRQRDQSLPQKKGVSSSPTPGTQPIRTKQRSSRRHPYKT